MVQPRLGGFSVWAICGLGVLLAVLVVVVDLGMIWNAQAEMRAVADSVALASAQTWAQHLSPTTKVLMPPAALAAASDEALRHVNIHAADGTLSLIANPENLPEGDIVFGFYDRPTGFVPARKEDLASPWLNAVRITIRRDRKHGNAPGLIFGPLFGWSVAEVQVSAVAVLQRHIVGLQCTDGQAIPMVPIAILSDPTGQSGDSWEVQVHAEQTTTLSAEAGNEDGPVVRVRLPVAASDVLTPMQPTNAAVQPSDSGLTRNNACVVQIGTDSWAQVVRQTATGVLPNDLRSDDFDGRLALDSQTGIRPLPAWLQLPSLDQRELADMLTTLDGLKERKEVRIWPLFVGFLPPANSDGNSANGSRMETAAVNGFVAARILRIEMKTAESTYVEIVLQPQLLLTRTVIPAPALSLNRLGEDSVWNPYLTQPNPYLVRIQLAE